MPRAAAGATALLLLAAAQHSHADGSNLVEVLGSFGSDVCPSGSTRIGTAAGCQAAAARMGLVHTVLTSTAMPAGCGWLNWNGVWLEQTPRLYFNLHATGTLVQGMKPVCTAAAPATTRAPAVPTTTAPAPPPPVHRHTCALDRAAAGGAGGGNAHANANPNGNGNGAGYAIVTTEAIAASTQPAARAVVLHGAARVLPVCRPCAARAVVSRGAKQVTGVRACSREHPRCACGDR